MSESIFQPGCGRPNFPTHLKNLKCPIRTSQSNRIKTNVTPSFCQLFKIKEDHITFIKSFLGDKRKQLVDTIAFRINEEYSMIVASISQSDTYRCCSFTRSCS